MTASAPPSKHSQAELDAAHAALREQYRRAYGDDFVKQLDKLVALPQEQFDRMRAAQFLGARAIGSWGDLTVMLDGESFHVVPGADRNPYLDPLRQSVGALHGGRHSAITLDAPHHAFRRSDHPPQIAGERP